MASKVGEAFVELTAKNAKLRTKLRQSETFSQKAADGMQQTFDRLGKRIFVGVTAALGAVFARRTIQSAMNVERLTNAFNSLAGGGTKATAMLAAMDEAFKGTVSQADIMVQTNNAMLLGLPKNAKFMSELAEAGRRLGKAVGKDATFGFESLVVGIGRQSRMMLDNLGIIVKAEDAYDRYAASLGKTAAELTDTEKRAAFMEATMAGIRDRMRQLGPDTEDTSEKWERLTATFKDALAVMGRGALEPVAEGIDSVNEKLEDMEPIFENVGGEAGRFFTFLIEGATDLAKYIDEASLKLREAFDAEGAAAIRAKRAQQEQEKAAAKALTEELARKKKERKEEEEALRQYEAYQAQKELAAQKAAEVINDLQLETLELSGFAGMRELSEFQERMKKLRAEYADNQAVMTAIEQVELARRANIREEQAEKELERHKEMREKREEIAKDAAEKELRAAINLNDALLQAEQDFLKRIGLEDEAALIEKKRFYDRLRELAKGNIEALRTINAMEVADRRRAELEKQAEIAKTNAFTPSFVGAGELFKRATIAGSTVQPQKVAPTAEEKKIAEATRKTAENTEKLVRQKEADVAVFAE